MAVGVLVPVLTQCGGKEVLGEKPPSSCDLAEHDRAGGGGQQRIEIVTFWTNQREKEAVNVLETSGSSPAYRIAMTSRKDRDDQQTSFKDWLESGDPLPDAFQANGGSDVLQWVDEGPPEAAQLCPLTHLDERYGFSDLFFESTLAPVSCHGTLYGLPVGVHRVNMLFYNRDVIDRLVAEAEARGLTLRRPEELRGIDDFLEHLDVIAALELETEQGALLLPLALDEDDTWPMAVLAFEDLMTSRGSELYKTVWMGRGPRSVAGGESSELAQAEDALRTSLSNLVADLQTLASHSNFSDPYRDLPEPYIPSPSPGEEPKPFAWEEALQMVAAGAAVYSAMGDWGWAQVAEQEQVVGAIPFPGTETAFIYTPDSFVVPRRDGTDGSGAHFWLEDVVADVETQIAFAQVKQSFPAVQGLPAEKLEGLMSDRLVDNYNLFTDCQSPDSGCQLLLAVSGLAPSPSADPCFDDVGELLVRTMGRMTQEDGDEERTCPLPLPEDPDAAGAELVERLVVVSGEQFAAACR